MRRNHPARTNRTNNYNYERVYRRWPQATDVKSITINERKTIYFNACAMPWGRDITAKTLTGEIKRIMGNQSSDLLIL